MKKKRNRHNLWYGSMPIFLLKMKLLSFLIFVSVATVTANSYSQQTKFNMNFENVTVRQIFQQIEDNSEFILLYSEKSVDVERKVKVEITNQTVDKILDQVFRGTKNYYEIHDRQIAIMEKGSTEKPFFVSSTSEDEQQKSISGKVTDSSGATLPGVSVVVKGTTTGTITDGNGNYSLSKIPENATLQFSFVGMKTQEIKIGTQTSINVVLAEDAIGIEEVVAVGYGTMRKIDITGSVSSIKSEEISKTASSSFENSLQGRMAGIQVNTKEGSPGSGLEITIRGGTSLNASNAPLYVIDGYPIIGSNESTGGEGLTSQSPLVTLNPSDIVSIEVLKDASSTAIYGSRGANGVILITTKGGSRDRVPTITFNSYTGVQELPKKLDVLTGAEFAEFMSRMSPEDSTYYSNGNLITEPSYNWQDELYRNALIQNYQVSIFGGNKITDYAVSAGYFNQEGIIIGTEFDRYSTNIKLNTNINNKLKVGINANLGVTENQGIVSAINGSFARRAGATFYALYYRPIFPPGTSEEQIESEDVNNVNPITLATRTVQKNQTSQILTNLFGEYEILNGLTLKISLGGNLRNMKAKNYYPGDFGVGKIQGGAIAELMHSQRVNVLNENTITYNNTFGGKHVLTAVGGYTQQKNVTEFFKTEAMGFTRETPDNLDNIGSATLTLPSSSENTKWGLESFLSRINYSFDDRYLFTFTFRADGSSRFAEGNKWGYFPSGAVAWRMNNEPFMDNLPFISNLKIRTSYGYTGNQEIGLYQSLSALSTGNYNYNNTLAVGYYPSRISNEDLRWETTEQIDFGIDIGLLKNRISLEADIYNKNTRDLLLNVPLPFTTGYENSLQNLGEVRNRGVELNLNTVNVKRKSFSWTTDVNFSMNRNEVISLGEDADEFYVNGTFWRFTGDFIVREGEPVGSIIGYKTDGVYQYVDFNTDDQGNLTRKQEVPYLTGTNPKPGDVKFIDSTGDGIVDSNDRVILGSANPLHYGGITNNFDYKGFDLSFFFQWSYGNETYNITRNMGLENNDYSNKLAEILNSWTPDNQNTRLWSYTGKAPEGILTDFLIEDGSFIRLSNVTLGYSIPSSGLKRYNIKNFRIYVSGDNLLLFTNYKGYDPDVSVSNNPLTPGIDHGAYPRSRTIRLGLILNL